VGRRYRSALVEPERFLVSLSRYIEMEPVRAGLASSPGAWPWSSYAGNAAEADDDLLCPHALYQALGPTRALRCQAYRALFAVNGEDPDLPIRSWETRRSDAASRPPSTGASCG
jgi:putative transposase